MRLNCVPSVGNYLVQNIASKGNTTSINAASDIKKSSSALYPMNYSKNYYLSFGARGMNLERFYNLNKERMPFSVKEHIENLEDINSETPLEAHVDAFSFLADPDIKTVEDIKFIFDNEPLFDKLKSVNETKATRGFLYEARIMEDALDESNEGILDSGEDLTVYLVKKIFLETKSLNEINEALDKDLNPVFKRDDKTYISYSTLDALGIELPALQYLTSLRTTDDNYSKKLGDLISKALKERTSAEAVKNGQALPAEEKTPREVSDETRKKQSKSQIERWDKLNDAERAELISKMQAGNKFQRVVMMDAWNQCPEIRKSLSEFLIEHNMHKPENIIYKTSEYSEYQARIMTEFWEKHHSDDESKDYAKILGRAIKDARVRAEFAEENGTFEEYIKETGKKSEQIKAEIKKSRKPIVSAERSLELAQERLCQTYKNAYSFLPRAFVDFYMKDAAGLDINAINAWCDILNGKKIESSRMEHLTDQMQTIKPDTFSREKNAIELAMKTILYESTKNPEVYTYDYKDLISSLQTAKAAKHFPLNVAIKNEHGRKDVYFIKRPEFNNIALLYNHLAWDIDDEKANNISAELIGRIAAYLRLDAKSADEEKETMTLATAIYLQHREEFLQEVKRMGNISSFIMKKDLPREGALFYIERFIENLGLEEEAEALKVMDFNK